MPTEPAHVTVSQTGRISGVVDAEEMVNVALGPPKSTATRRHMWKAG